MRVGTGTVAAGYQNFFICIEMFCAAIVLRFAFPHNIYSADSEITTGRTVSLQSISSSLKETMNPKDIMNDAIHNFHPQYQQYTQQGTEPTDDCRHGPMYQEQRDGNYQNAHRISQPGSKSKLTEKSTLLDSDEDFQ